MVHTSLCEGPELKETSNRSEERRVGKECVIKTLYVLTKSAGGVFLILLGVALVRIWLKC